MHTANAIRNASLANAKSMIKENMTSDDRWLVRGLLAIYDRQTRDEQDSAATKHNNEIGFNGLDASILTSFAQQVERWQDTPSTARRFNSPLSPKQIGLVRRKMAKYAGQLARIVREGQPA